jgi:heme/copper-type cytochrome/quinol oxidase subunit 3
MRHRPVQDIRDLPTYAFGPGSPVWWGTLAFITLEGTGFVLTAAAYLFLHFMNADFPLSAPPPELLWSTAVTVVMLASAWPNQMAKKNSEEEDIRKVRRDLVIMSLAGFVLLGLRAFEFTTLNVRWDQNAYGSLVWVLLGLHTVHLLTDVGDTLVLTALMFTKHGRGKRFSDVSDNAFYWYFVVATWVPIYLLIYWMPRW